MSYGPLNIQFKHTMVKMEFKCTRNTYKEKMKLKPPPLEYFHGKFKTSACVFYLSL
jgi:hypothetical protein